jgi:hypothetical protein
MKSNSGVKPKMRSNALCVALLFLFVASTVRALPVYTIYSDTLIVDGEVVEIEREEVSTNTDSLRQIMRDDIARKKIPLSMTVGAVGGAAFHFIQSEHQVAGFTEVGGFTGNDASTFSVQPTFGAFVEFPIYKSSGVNVSFMQSKVVYENKYFQPGILAPLDARRGFRTDSGQLIEDYILAINPGFEERSREVPLETQRIQFNYTLIPVRLFYTFSTEKLSIAPRIGYTFASQRISGGDGYFVYLENEGVEVLYVENTSSSFTSTSHHYIHIGAALRMPFAASWSLSAELDYHWALTDQFQRSNVIISYQPIALMLGVSRSISLRK